MSEQKNYTFSLPPKGKITYAAGEYDVENHKPRYEMEINCPEHVRRQIEYNQILLGTREYCQWAYKIYNRSSYTIFIIVKKDGVLIRK